MSTAAAEAFIVRVPPPRGGVSPPRSAVEVRAIFRGVTTHARLLTFPTLSRRRAPGRQFTIGSESGVDAPVAQSFLPWASHPLVMAAGDDYVVNVTPHMTGTVDDTVHVLPLAEYVRQKGASFLLPARGTTQVACGAVTFIVARTSPPRPLPPTPLRWRWDDHVYTAGSALALLALLLVTAFVPADPRSLSLDMFEPGSRFLPFTIKAPEQVEAILPWLAPHPAGAAGQKGEKARGPEGAMGDKASTRTRARHAIAGPADNPDPRMAKLQAIEAAKHAGILGVFKAVDGSPLASVLGADTALGRDAETVLGDLASPLIGSAAGAGGLGVMGTGAAAAGTGERPLGTGGLATIGDRNGAAGSDRYGDGVGALHRRRAVPPRWLQGQATVRGSLDKEIVRRVIRLHINEIKYCYEQELAKRPGLGGRIVVQFGIAATGQVITSALQSSTMASAAVESCTVQAVRRWPFPKPDGGGLVLVSYPFVLAPAGQ